MECCNYPCQRWCSSICRFTAMAKHVCFKEAPGVIRTASIFPHRRDEAIAVNDGARWDPAAASTLRQMNWVHPLDTKWDTASHSSKVYSLSPSQPELLTDGFEIQLKGWGVGAGVGVGAFLAPRLVAMSSGPGRKMKESDNGVFFLFFFFLIPPQLFTSGTQWFWCDLLFSEPRKHLGSCWVWLNYNRWRENNAANQTEYI